MAKPEAAVRLLRWEPWDRSKGHARLAQYVSPPALADLQLGRGVARARDVEPDVADRALASALYERVREREIDYALDPPVPAGGQQIRHPRWILDDGWATCLDIAAMYAALCLAAKVGVLLAVTADHAFVVLTPGRLHDAESGPYRLGALLPQPDGALAGAASEVGAAIRDGRVVGVDCFRAARSDDRPSASFEEAVEAVEEHTRWGTVWLVDVPWLHANGIPPLPDPAEVRPSISRYVRATKVAFEPYGSHRKAIAALERETGLAVLCAPAGRGKSTVARELALSEPTGAGWFLTAADQQALIGSLADAALAELNRRGGELPLADRRDHALSALEALRSAEGRWVVVLDNADGDPAKIVPWVPRPDPAQGQLVLVTTTNPAWEAIPGFTPHTLDPITDDEIRGVLGEESLVKLVAGRPLLVDAFRRLKENTGWRPSGSPGDDPRIAALDAELHGPAVLWAAVRGLDGFDERALRVAGLSAYLPPDHQPRDVFGAAIDGDARPTLDFLVSAGLLTPDEDDVLLRMHRLVGMALRADLEESRPALADELAALVVTDERTQRALRERGDLDTMSLLDARLTDERLTRDVDTTTGVTLHGLATLLELHGHTRRSGDVFGLALPHLDERLDLAADCHHGKARTINQHHTRLEDVPLLEEALGWAETAERLMTEAGKRDDAARCLAMRGLLTQKLGKHREGEEGVALLKEALRMIEEADERRRASTSRTEEELARSHFNKAGIRIELAKAEPERASEYLARAREVYDHVRTERQRIYGRLIHPHVAACEIGLGYVDYYEALLLYPEDDVRRTDLLRSATRQALIAIATREGEEGQIDGDETAKCLQFLAKVMLARRASAAVSKRAIGPVMSEVQQELDDAGLLRES